MLNVKEIKNKIESMSFLQKGWDSYDAEPPSKSSIDRAKSFVLKCVGAKLPIVAVNPTIVGGVAIKFKKKSYRGFIEVLNTGTINVVLSSTGNSSYESDVTERKALVKLIKHFK